MILLQYLNQCAFFTVSFSTIFVIRVKNLKKICESKETPKITKYKKSLKMQSAVRIEINDEIFKEKVTLADK